MFLLVIDTATPAAELSPEDDDDAGKEKQDRVQQLNGSRNDN